MSRNSSIINKENIFCNEWYLLHQNNYNFQKNFSKTHFCEICNYLHVVYLSITRNLTDSAEDTCKSFFKKNLKKHSNLGF
jgi:hypothetical protein